MSDASIVSRTRAHASSVGSSDAIRQPSEGDSILDAIGAHASVRQGDPILDVLSSMPNSRRQLRLSVYERATASLRDELEALGSLVGVPSSSYPSIGSGYEGLLA